MAEADLDVAGVTEVDLCDADAQVALEQAAIPGTPEAEAATDAVLEIAGAVPGTPEAEAALEQAAIPGTPEAEAATEAVMEEADLDVAGVDEVELCDPAA